MSASPEIPDPEVTLSDGRWMVSVSLEDYNALRRMSGLQSLPPPVPQPPRSTQEPRHRRHGPASPEQLIGRRSGEKTYGAARDPLESFTGSFRKRRTPFPDQKNPGDVLDSEKPVPDDHPPRTGSYRDMKEHGFEGNPRDHIAHGGILRRDRQAEDHQQRRRNRKKPPRRKGR